MKKITHHTYKNLFMIWEYDLVIEYYPNGHIKREYKINETMKRR